MKLYEQDRRKQGIYAIVYKPTHRIVYVGQTVDLTDRTHKHKHSATNTKDKVEYNKPLYRAMRKHGIDNYSIGLLEEVADARLLTEKEQYYYELLDGKNKLYNLAEPSTGLVLYLGKAVYQIDPITFEIVQEYPSTKAAARAMMVSAQALISVLKGKWSVCAGYH
jgi:hypothetical protein